MDLSDVSKSIDTINITFSILNVKLADLAIFLSS